jgi:DNA-binding HxlR family transcriptional regulator
MTQDSIPERVKEFVFNNIDSVELLEVLFTLRADRTCVWDVDSLNDRLRSSRRSIQHRLNTLIGLRLITEARDETREAKVGYYYTPANEEVESLISELWKAYEVNRYTLFALIFSPMKKARYFADAFRISKSPEDEEGNDNG